MCDPGSSPTARCTLWPRVCGLAAGLALILVAVRLQAQLWETQGDLAPFWWLLVVGVLFAVLMDTTFGPRSIAPPALHPAETPTPPAPDARRRYVILLAAALVAEAVSLGLFRVGWLLDLPGSHHSSPACCSSWGSGGLPA